MAEHSDDGLGGVCLNHETDVGVHGVGKEIEHPVDASDHPVGGFHPADEFGHEPKGGSVHPHGATVGVQQSSGQQWHPDADRMPPGCCPTARPRHCLHRGR